MNGRFRFLRLFHLGKKLDDSGRRIYYRGSSMGHTFRPGDLLYVVPRGRKEIRCGDVVVFIAPATEKQIVHRVVSVDPQGIRTRGDSSWKEDDYLLKPDHILGRVMYAKGKRRWRRVHGGVRGKWCAFKVRIVRRVEFGISSWILPRLRRMPLVETLRRVMQKRLPTRIIAINRSEGTELQLLLGRVVMGRLLPGRKTWNLWWPTRLFVGQESLPTGESVGKKLSGDTEAST